MNELNELNELNEMDAMNEINEMNDHRAVLSEKEFKIGFFLLRISNSQFGWMSATQFGKQLIQQDSEAID